MTEVLSSGSLMGLPYTDRRSSLPRSGGV